MGVALTRDAVRRQLDAIREMLTINDLEMRCSVLILINSSALRESRIVFVYCALYLRVRLLRKHNCIYRP